MFIATTATTVTKLRRSEILSRSYGAEIHVSALVL
jgi:hypothetical protein